MQPITHHHPQMTHLASQMLQSRIEPDPPPLSDLPPFSYKVPKALTQEVEAFHWRASVERPGIRQVSVCD